MGRKRKTSEDDDVTGDEANAGDSVRPGPNGRLARLNISPYLLRPLRSLEEAMRDGDETAERATGDEDDEDEDDDDKTGG